MRLTLLIVGLLIGVAGFAADTGAELFQKARTQETAAGDLDEAIRLYQRVVKEFTSDRALAAKALMAEARCYEKLGQNNATKLYEQVARDYRDQPEQAAAATARLASLRQGERAAEPAVMTQRKLEFPDSAPPFYLRTDGRHTAYLDDSTSALMMSDPGGGKRVLFRQKDLRPANFVLSRDASVVFMVLRHPDTTRTFGVVKADGTDFHEIAAGLQGCNQDTEISWDSRYVLMCRSQTGKPSELFRVSLSGAETQKIGEALGSIYRFSPDGHFLAYYTSERKIFVMPSQGGEPQLVADHAFLHDWTRDGLYLITDVVKDGVDELNLVPVTNGKPSGRPVFVRYGDFIIGRSTAGGGFIYNATPQDGRFTTWLGTLNPAADSLGWEKLRLTGTTGGETWSPDSTRIAYLTNNGAAGQFSFDLHVRNIANGEERSLYRSDRDTDCLWSAQHPSLYCVEQGPPVAAFTISVDTGRVEPLGAVPGVDGFLVALADNDRVIYLSSQKEGMIRWEIGADHTTTVLENDLPSKRAGSFEISSDARWIVRLNGKIEIRAIAGGDWMAMTPAAIRPNNLSQSGFTPDGDFFFYRDTDAAGNGGLFRVATSGGQPKRLGDLPPDKGQINCAGGGCLRISPDGRKILVEFPSPNEVWMLENFEPKPRTAN